MKLTQPFVFSISTFLFASVALSLPNLASSASHGFKLPPAKISSSTTFSQEPQKTPSRKPVPNPDYVEAPVLSEGVSPHFQTEILAIEQLIQDQKFDDALKELKSMPSQRISIIWDDRNVPQSEKTSFRNAMDAAISNWKLALPLSVAVYTPGDPLSKKLKGKPEIKFEFANKLNQPEGAKEPLSLASFWSDAQKSAHYDVVIGLKRGIPLAKTTPLEIANDVTYSLSKYWGLADSPIIGSFSYRVEGQTSFPNTGIQVDKQIIASNINAVTDLTEFAKKKNKMTAAHSGLFISPEKIVVDSKTIEGDKVAIAFQVTNFGNGPLRLRIIPDCSCFSTDLAKSVAPGESILYHVQMDTSQYYGNVHKVLYLMSNDPQRPTMSIPVDVKVTPRYRILTPKGTDFISKDGTYVNHIYLTTDGGPLKIISYDLGGSKGTVTMHPWTGVLSDPGQNQGPEKRSGYEFTITCGPHMQAARNMYTLNIVTDDTSLATLHSSFSVTYGIVAVPSSIDLGIMPGSAASVFFKIHRDGKPFKVLGASCSISHFKVEKISGNGKEYTFKLIYDGLKMPGKFQGVIKVKTNDPAQPLVQIPLQGVLQ